MMHNLPHTLLSFKSFSFREKRCLFNNTPQIPIEQQSLPNKLPEQRHDFFQEFEIITGIISDVRSQGALSFTKGWQEKEIPDGKSQEFYIAELGKVMGSFIFPNLQIEDFVIKWVHTQKLLLKLKQAGSVSITDSVIEESNKKHSQIIVDLIKSECLLLDTQQNAGRSIPAIENTINRIKEADSEIDKERINQQIEEVLLFHIESLFERAKFFSEGSSIRLFAEKLTIINDIVKILKNAGMNVDENGINKRIMDIQRTGVINAINLGINYLEECTQNGRIIEAKDNEQKFFLYYVENTLEEARKLGFCIDSMGINIEEFRKKISQLTKMNSQVINSKLSIPKRIVNHLLAGVRYFRKR